MWTAAEVAGEPPRTEPVQVHQVSADYTATFGIRLAAGTAARPTPMSISARRVALVNERFVRTRIPNGRRSGRSSSCRG